MRSINRIVGSVAVLVLSASCATTTVPGIHLDPDDFDRAVSERGLDPQRVVHPFEVTPEMTAWAAAHVPAGASEEEAVGALAHALLDPEQLAITYAWGTTGTAADVFTSRRANCLAFTNLFVGLARSLDLPVYFLLVEGAESYRKSGDLVVVSDHIAVGHGWPDGRLVLDVGSPEDVEYRAIERISDLAAVALFHANRGAESLQAGRVEEAVGWLRTAVALDPERAGTWGNYGVALRRSGDLAGAETAYRRALALDPSQLSAAHNLAALLRLIDRHDEARAVETALVTGSNRNPYTYLALGDVSRDWGRLDEAGRLYRRAARLGAAPEAWAALGQLAIHAGDRREARRWLDRALEENDPAAGVERIDALRAMLDGLDPDTLHVAGHRQRP